MATRAHSTRTPLLPLSGARPPLLREGSGRQPGPVTLAVRTMRAAHLDDDAPVDGRQAALEALRIEDPAIEGVPVLRALRLALLASIETGVGSLPDGRRV